MDAIRWGKREGVQRYRCLNCGILFRGRRPEVSVRNRQIWFEKWVDGPYDIGYFDHESGYGKGSLQRYFSPYLSQTLVLELRRGEKGNLMIDGTYFANGLCLILYRDDRVKYNQLYRLTDGDWFEEIKEDLENLLLLGIEIESTTCDVHRSVLKAIR